MKKVIFLDRDGVINKDPGGWTKHNYVTRKEDFIFLPRAKEAIKKLSSNGYEIIVISNQAGIAKGHYTQEALQNVNAAMLREIEAAGGRIKKVYYCVHQDSDDCDCRKPKIGLFKQAERELKARVRGSYFIGDGRTDVEAGRSADMKTILVLCGKTTLDDIRNWAVKPDYIFDDLSEAVEFILRHPENTS